MNDGFTLIEVMIMIALTVILAVIGVTTMPRTQDTSTNGMENRLASTLESAHTQALAERIAVTLTGTTTKLQVSTSDGTETVSFSPAQLTGTITIQPDGLTSGQLDLQITPSTCARYTLTSYGTSATGPC